MCKNHPAREYSMYIQTSIYQPKKTRFFFGQGEVLTKKTFFFCRSDLGPWWSPWPWKQGQGRFDAQFEPGMVFAESRCI